jgi:hypothetical protein
MKIKAASLFGVSLALAVIAFAAPAQARDNNGYGNYLSSGVSGNTAYGYNQNVGYSGFGNNQSLLNQVAQIQQQLSAGNFSSRDRNKLVNRLNKLQVRLGNQNYGANGYNNGILSNLRNQYLNNGSLNNGSFNNGYLNNGLGVNGLANSRASNFSHQAIPASGTLERCL